ncbi:Hypothetical protein A7982_10303 [Minicystis rosea]|nr:Hypothetical protein A7982_10303 [Minicystis rosea]
MALSMKKVEEMAVKQVASNDEPEDSGVFVSRSQMALDVAIGELRAGAAGEPMPIYATPYVRQGKNRTRYTQDYCLGVRFANGVIEAASWEEEMIRDGLPAFVIERCREFLAENAM